MVDYFDFVGYVVFGVILMVNDMKEVEYKGCDKFVLGDVIVFVICKLKYIYLSFVINWVNDLFVNRYIFWNEYEMFLEGVLEIVVLVNFLFEEFLFYFIVMRDFVF